MGILSRVDSWFRGVLKGAGSKSGVNWGDPRKLTSFMHLANSGGGFYPSAWTEPRIEEVKHFKHWVYVAISRIAEKVAQQIPNISSVTHDGLSAGVGADKTYRRTLSMRARRKALTPLQSHENLEHVSHDHPLVRLLKDPNDLDTAYDLWYETILFLLLTGSAYWYIPKLGKTKFPAAIWVVPSHWVWPVIGSDGDIKGYEVRPIEGNYMRKFMAVEDVIHIRRKSPISKIDGYAPLTAVATWADTQESIDRTRWYSFKNGAFPGVAIEFDNKYLDPSDEDLLRIEAKFVQRYTGEIKANKPLFLPPGTKLQHFSFSPAEMAFVQSAEQIRDNILAGFGVPPSIAGVGSDLTYGSIIASQAWFCSGTICPLLAFLGQCITEKLGWIYDQNLRVWWEDITPQDPELLEKQYLTDSRMGAITLNELRTERGREPYEGKRGDQVLIQGALMLMDMNSEAPPVGLNTGVDKPAKDEEKLGIEA